ncbi:MAG: cysteine desulfurase [Myxococcales bacterium]|nr:cysteine desulfurase [Myxococcales bacterium]
MIYLDHHAAAPTPDAVRLAMERAAVRAWANPSSTHAAGRASRQLLEAARERVAESIGASAADVVLTAGGTEACNLGIRGLAKGCSGVVTSDIEHPAVARSVDRLQRDGFEVTRLRVLKGQPPNLEELARHLVPRTLVAIQWVNHETGTILPIDRYAKTCREHDARLFVDATQALGKLPIDVGALGADAVALAAQKIGGPAGAGACWIRRGLDLEPVLDGGSQERGRRPGTPDTLSMVGFGAACGLIETRLEQQPRVTALRDRIEKSLLAQGAVQNAVSPRTGTVANLSFPGWQGPLLVAALDLEEVCLSTGAACSSGLQEPSAVIRAMYPDEQWRAGSAVRISLGMETSQGDIDLAIASFARVVARRDV